MHTALLVLQGFDLASNGHAQISPGWPFASNPRRVGPWVPSKAGRTAAGGAGETQSERLTHTHYSILPCGRTTSCTIVMRWKYEAKSLPSHAPREVYIQKKIYTVTKLICVKCLILPYIFSLVTTYQPTSGNPNMKTKKTIFIDGFLCYFLAKKENLCFLCKKKIWPNAFYLKGVLGNLTNVL